MSKHILVPLDGSVLAECVLSHLPAIASSVHTRVTLLHVLEHPRAIGDEHTIDPIEWHFNKIEAGIYLDKIARRLSKASLNVKNVILEGRAADCIIDYANDNEVTLIVLSTHGRSGLSGWNISSVAQKIILRSFKSIFLVRAYKSPKSELVAIHYKRIFIGLDCSARAEYILPIAVNLAQFHKSKLILGIVLREPEISNRFPLTDEDTQLLKRVLERNHRAASQYIEGLQKQLSLQGVESVMQLVASNHVSAALHDMVEQQAADLVMLAAHGHSGEGRWPYGSIATSFITYGTTSLMIMQDLPADEIQLTRAEIVACESRGH